MRQLDEGYTYQVDNIDKNAWHNLLGKFNDSSFYQTWSYGAISWEKESLSHLILRKNDEIISIAQLRTAKLPLMPIGFAYLSWGPIWRKKGGKNDYEILRNMLRALYSEYVKKRLYLLRIIPKQIHDNEDAIIGVYKDEGFSWLPDPQKTIYVDLTPSLDEIRKNMGSGWKKTLRRSMNIDMDLIEDDEASLNDTAISLVREMKKRKGFADFGSMENNLIINNDLPNELKMKLVFCKFENELVAVFGWSKIGETGIPLVSATGNNASKSLAPHRFYWKMIEYYKNNGFRKCDLGGINKKNNPGGYQFKAGVAGATRIEKNYIGQFDLCENYFSSFCFKTGMSFRQHCRSLLAKVNRMKSYR